MLRVPERYLGATPAAMRGRGMGFGCWKAPPGRPSLGSALCGGCGGLRQWSRDSPSGVESMAPPNRIPLPPKVSGTSSIINNTIKIVQLS